MIFNIINDIKFKSFRRKELRCLHRYIICFLPCFIGTKKKSYEYSTMIFFFTSDLNLEALGTPRTIFRVDILDFVLKPEAVKQPMKTDGFSVGENVLMAIDIIRKKSGGRNLRRGKNINKVCDYV